jgi:hypothetical protein
MPDQLPVPLDCRLPAADFNGIDNADDRRINGTFLAAKSHPRGASLNDQNDFVNARPYRVNHDDMALLILAVHIDQPRDKKFSPMQAIIFARRDYCSNYSCKNHV